MRRQAHKAEPSRLLRFAFALGLALLAAMPLPAHAVAPGEQLADPQLEARARALSIGLRCLVCQNQSIDDSDAPLARDLRLLVRERLLAGDDDAAIREFLVARYGQFVLLKPPLSEHTLVLWALPLVALLVGGFAARGVFRAARRESGPAMPLTDAESAALAALLAGKEGETAKQKIE